MNYKELKTCLCCQSNALKQVIDLGNQPLANSFHDLKTEIPKFPLVLNVCTDCWHLQLSVAVSTDLLYKNYKYVSGTTQTLKDYFDWFAKLVTEHVANDDGDINKMETKVLDVGCNDGSQLDALKREGWINTYGIDPAENIIPITSKNHIVKCGYFQHSNHFGNTKFDAIIAQNVFAHTYNLIDFLSQASISTTDNGYIFIQVSQADMIQKNEFDTIYHEHISFFNINSFINLLDQFNEKYFYGAAEGVSKLYLFDVIKTPIHGNSYVFVLNKKKELAPANIKNLINFERSQGLYNIKTYVNYANNIKKIKNDLTELVQKIDKKYKFIGYGAAAKGMTALNYFNLPIKIDYIVDDNPLKQGLKTPGTDIPIYSIEALKELKGFDVVFIPLAWNFFDEIVLRLDKAGALKNGDKFIKYFPKVDLIEYKS